MLFGLDLDRLERWNGDENLRLLFSSLGLSVSLDILVSVDIRGPLSGVVMNSGSSDGSREDDV